LDALLSRAGQNLEAEAASDEEEPVDKNSKPKGNTINEKGSTKRPRRPDPALNNNNDCLSIASSVEQGRSALDALIFRAGQNLEAEADRQPFKNDRG
jgi:hypothetical protein